MAQVKLADQLVIRITPLLRTALAAAAATNGQPLATYARRVLEDHAQRRLVSEALAAGFALDVAIGADDTERTSP